MMISFAAIESPIGRIVLGLGERGLAAVEFLEDRESPRDRLAKLFPRGELREDSKALAPAVKQLREYFARKRRQFDLPLEASGTTFQRAVWRELRKIPYGETRSYADIARAVRNPKAVRAVGAANGRNLIGIIVPCHRVIGSNGSLTGYGGGLSRKRFLLELERSR
jgi:methylated-DNA-[protein]-cysteine S-methyltransferase